jgi:hypothetical protein
MGPGACRDAAQGVGVVDRGRFLRDFLRNGLRHGSEGVLRGFRGRGYFRGRGRGGSLSGYGSLGGDLFGGLGLFGHGGYPFSGVELVRDGFSRAGTIFHMRKMPRSGNFGV